MPKFAHISDIHLGANSDPVLSRLEMEAFNKTIDTCLEENVDFILICGDLFHVSKPEFHIVDEVVRRFKQLLDKEIPVYVIYGSHDYTPNGISIIDIIESAGLIKKIVSGKIVDEKLQLDFFTDQKTNTKLVGISGRKGGLDKEYYEILDREKLEKESGFKIFAFHACLDELKPAYLSKAESCPVSVLPKGFDYYAGGHVHERLEEDLQDYKHIIFPGALFGSQTRDHEASSKGEKRGFYIASFGDTIDEIKFVPIKVCEYLFKELDVEDRNSQQAEKLLTEELESIDVIDKVVTLKIKGELSGGKTSDINFSKIQQNLVTKGALTVYLNRYGLKSKEYAMIKAAGEDASTIERKLLKENLGTIKVSQDLLKGDKGLRLALELLNILRESVKSGESKQDYAERMKEQGIRTFQLKEVFSS